ncbi:MAG: hypothetical protein ABIH48_00360 [Candidatus Falkowbacteria bacterium]
MLRYYITLTKADLSGPGTTSMGILPPIIFGFDSKFSMEKFSACPLKSVFLFYKIFC